MGMTAASATSLRVRRRVRRPSNCGGPPTSGCRSCRTPCAVGATPASSDTPTPPDPAPCAHGCRAPEPARRALRPAHRGLDLHDQLIRRVNEHLPHTDLAQVQPHPHNIASHRGPPGSLVSQSPIPAGPRPLLRNPQPPDLAGDCPSRGGPQAQCRCVHRHRHPPRGEGRGAGRFGGPPGPAAVLCLRVRFSRFLRLVMGIGTSTSWVWRAACRAWPDALGCA